MIFRIPSQEMLIGGLFCEKKIEDKMSDPFF